MKLQELKDAYYGYSGKLSDVCRQLNFAGIAIVWIFRIGQSNADIPFNPCLLGSLKLFIFSLGFDLLHYIYSTIAWGMLHRIREKHTEGKESVKDAPRSINWPTNAFFWAKVVTVVWGYAILVIYLWDKF
jgi:hypothetical protein